MRSRLLPGEARVIVRLLLTRVIQCHKITVAQFDHDADREVPDVIRLSLCPDQHGPSSEDLFCLTRTRVDDKTRVVTHEYERAETIENRRLTIR